MITALVLVAMVVVVPTLLILGALAAVGLTVAALAVTDRPNSVSLALRPGPGA